MREPLARILPALILLTAWQLPPAEGATIATPGAAGWCGTHDLLLEQMLARHLLNRRLDRDRPALRAPAKLGVASAVEVRQEGNVAVVIDNDGRMIRDRNLLDLDSGFAMRFRFKKRQGGYQVKAGGSFSDELGEKLDLSDDDSIEIELPFTVKYFDGRFDSVFVNSDGNVTFGAGDSLSTARDMTRFLDGPPRIAPFFADLNPETAAADGGVFVDVGSKSVRITWVRVPEFEPSGQALDLNTFQLTLKRNGKATFAYGEMESLVGIVGLAPGGGSAVDLLDYTEELPSPVVIGAVAESFSNQLTVDEAAVAQVFLENFEDRYMTLVVFTDFQIVLLEPGVLAYEQTIQNAIRGIGEGLYDFSEAFGSDGALESFVMMGNLDTYGGDIDGRVLLGGVYTPLEVLLHEIGHRWGVRTMADLAGQPRNILLGRQQAHWSFCFNSRNSYLEGNHWQDPDGDGVYTAVAGPASFNDFDLYSMGLLDPGAVESSFVIAGACNGDRAPSFEGAASGERIDVTIDDVLSALGPRRPAFPETPRAFEVAFVLLVRGGEEPREGSVGLVNAFRQGAAQKMAEQGGELKTRLRPR